MFRSADSEELRDVVPPRPHEVREGADTFGLATRCRPRTVGSGGARARVLICAPSNAALDEIVLRIVTGGVLGADGGMYGC